KGTRTLQFRKCQGSSFFWSFCCGEPDIDTDRLKRIPAVKLRKVGCGGAGGNELAPCPAEVRPINQGFGAAGFQRFPWAFRLRLEQFVVRPKRTVCNAKRIAE